MTVELQALKLMKYPGRMIAIGRAPNGKHDVIIYAITGRSSSSQARKLEFHGEWLHVKTHLTACHTRRVVTCQVKSTDRDGIGHGDPELLIYPAMIMDGGIAVSNGRQTEDLMMAYTADAELTETMRKGLSGWTYEPDKPHFTPRISGFLVPGRKNAILSIIRRGDGGGAAVDHFEFSLLPGEGRMITTYSGVNTDPLPSFSGEPQVFGIGMRSISEIAEDVYRSLGPREPGRDLRVAVAVVFASGEKVEKYIINRCEREQFE